MVNLILKDFRANKKVLSLCGVSYLFFLSFIFLYYEGSMYLFESFMMIKIIIFVLFGFEKRRKNETLWLSLPIKRVQIVLARYAASLLLLMVGMLLFLSLAFFLEQLFPGAPTDFRYLLHPGRALTYVLLIVLFMALFFPLIFRLGMLRGALAGVGLILPFFAVAPVFYNDSAFNGVDWLIMLAGFSGGPGFYPLMSLAMLALLGVSALLSIRGFRAWEV